MSISSKTNKVLLIIGVFLIILIFSLLIYYKKTRRVEEEKIEKINNTKEVKEEVYDRKVFGDSFDFGYINDATLLDEVDGIRFMEMENKYYLIKDDGLLNCEFEDEKYKFCIIDDKYKVDFTTNKIVKNNG